jgi:hypothetical protein
VPAPLAQTTHFTLATPTPMPALRAKPSRSCGSDWARAGIAHTKVIAATRNTKDAVLGAHVDMSLALTASCWAA